MNSRKKQLKLTTSKSFKKTLHFTGQALDFPIEMFNFVRNLLDSTTDGPDLFFEMFFDNSHFVSNMFFSCHHCSREVCLCQTFVTGIPIQ